MIQKLSDTDTDGMRSYYSVNIGVNHRSIEIACYAFHFGTEISILEERQVIFFLIRF